MERVAQAIANCLADGEGRLWEIGDVLVALPRGRGVLTTLAGMVGRSTAFLSQIRTTSKAFIPGTRAVDHPWKTHYLCATTPRPHYWLEIAVREDLPARVLIERMMAEGDKTPRRPKSDETIPDKWRGVITAARDVVEHGPELIPTLKAELEKAGAA